MASSQALETSSDALKTATSKKWPVWAIVWFTALLAVMLAALLIDPTGWLGSDDAYYHSAAEYVLAGETFHRVHHHFARMALVVPVAASIALFGDSPSMVALPTVLAALSCVGAVVILGRLLWGWAEGLLAAGVVAFLPYFRVMSTAAYPDVHTCLWAAVGVLLVAWAVRAVHPRRAWLLAIGCGFAVGLGSSAKIFAGMAVIPIIWIIWLPHGWQLRRRMGMLAAVGLGLAAYCLVDGLFYLRFGDDFWFKLHALQSAQAEDHYFPKTGYYRASTYLGLAWDRMTMLFHPGISGWGRVAVLFFPTAIVAFFLDGRGRAMAAWAIGAYAVIALVPVTHHNGWHPFTPFDGRHILVTCIPFALCLGLVGCRLITRMIGPGRLQRAWPVVLGLLVWLSFADGGTVNGFRDRPTSRVGVALQRLIASAELDGDYEIFVPASVYLRYRVLFPQDLRNRLRVAVDADAPDWWRQACVSITSRHRPLPAPTQGCLIASPRQLEGGVHFWDYGVGLPRRDLDAWQNTTPQAGVSRFEDRTIALNSARAEKGSELLLLLGTGEKRDLVLQPEKSFKGLSPLARGE